MPKKKKQKNKNKKKGGKPTGGEIDFVFTNETLEDFEAAEPKAQKKSKPKKFLRERKKFPTSKEICL